VLEDVGNAIQKYTEADGVVRELVGHGLGQKCMKIPECQMVKKGRGKLYRGMVVAIEPMINNRTRNIKQHVWTALPMENHQLILSMM
jgi:methionyl aminopeptidase